MKFANQCSCRICTTICPHSIQIREVSALGQNVVSVFHLKPLKIHYLQMAKLATSHCLSLLGQLPICYHPK